MRIQASGMLSRSTDFESTLDTTTQTRASGPYDTGHDTYIVYTGCSNRTAVVDDAYGTNICVETQTYTLHSVDVEKQFNSRLAVSV